MISAIAILALTLSPLFVPTTVTVVHGLTNLCRTNRH
ncbi:Uncharacterised protein [Mycobacteroides abscessus subsp. bolletii]|nr:Uncharacterised protein [Mycobacteroides abscessus subsp. bolletii]SKH12401.1 Uncharacterised protein [Mycobacteroides abscessus subsp. bolletii]